MRVLHHKLGTVYVPGADDSLDNLFRLRESTPWFAADTETTGLNQYKSDFRVRIVQMGSRDEAWILRPEWHQDAISKLTTRGDVWWHNWVFDAVGVEQSPNLRLDFDEVADAAHDTGILSRLLDPRPVEKGGTGHKLEDIGYHYLGTDSKKEAKTALWEAWGRRHKVPIKDIFAEVPVDLDEYLLYAGQDVFLTARAAEKLSTKVDARGLRKFYDFERPLSRRLALMQRIGMPFDYEWADRVEAEYLEELADAERELREVWKIDQGGAKYCHSSAKGMRAWFETRGVKWTKFSKKTGEPSLDKSVLDVLAQKRGDVGRCALAIRRAKHHKHYADYIAGMREATGADGRLHPKINPMEAATHRMSIEKGLHQLPRDDPRPRGCLLADDGERVLTADYAQIEFRVGAAVSGDPVITRKIRNGEDLHGVTATALFGADYTKQQRQVAKPVGFGRLYLGGAQGIWEQMLAADTTGQVPSLSAVKRAIAANDREYRVYKRWALRLKARVEDGNGQMTTATGRKLLVSPTYAAPNYYIQSTARDLFATGINNIHKVGLGCMLRLPVHDEVVMSVPRDRAEEIGEAIEEAMSMTFMDVPIAIEWELKEERWAK